MKKWLASLSVFIVILWMGVTLLAGIFGAISGGQDADCSAAATSSGTAAQAPEGTSVTEDQLVVAKKIQAVALEYGLDENKAYGAIGNAEQESSLMPPFVELNHLWSYWANANSVEDAVREIQKHGTKAEALFVNGFNSVIAAYGGGLSDEGYRGGSPDGSHWVGFGIWQWTGYNGVMPYFDWADANKKTKADIDSILLFAFSDSSEFFKPYTAEGDYYYKRLEKIKAMPAASSPAEGAAIWLNHYEYAGQAPGGGGLVHLDQRQQYATNWAVRLGKEKVDTDYGKSIISQANTMSAQKNSEKNTNNCGKSSSSAKGKGGHPYNHDYYWTAAFRTYNKARTIAAANFGFSTHNGIDVVADWGIAFSPKGEKGEIFSVYNGTVVGKSPGFGQILIKSEPADTGLDKPVVLEYTHLLIDGAYGNVQIGDKIEAGQRIGTEGDTGSPGLTHLHFGVLNADAVANGVNLWTGINLDEKNYGGSVDDPIIDPGLVLEGIEIGWFDTAAPNYLGDEFIQPNPLQIRVDGTTKEDPRLSGKGK
ncbi:phage tail tip lysozyme [Streptococcus danieliae]|uniref:Peptidoglycan DD-metalloendopeptidase family protein n=1 Tax=Streptococcus danieliae TaxID=747656 RepID=A0A7Z0S6F2_9STRE|nr:phage tail tip lysozyme [Streptococcus danieliae]MBF0699504.1 peptidoglycan DD-metalloendopeptidase family protein [Streptococcus danieliae]NYS96680.1 peptidoglycan DD-metalloendopeptidase family protein [Streptococcus danieliae]